MEENRPASSLLTETSDLRYLAPADLRFFNHGSTLRLTIAGQMSCLQVAVVRLFPLSTPERYLSIRHSDNTEIGVVVEPEALDEESRRLVAAALERRYLMPIVQRILGVKERFGTVDWQVDTDRGPCSFTMRNVRENVVPLSAERYILTDTEGNRYDLRDFGALDATSRAYFLQYV